MTNKTNNKQIAALTRKVNNLTVKPKTKKTRPRRKGNGSTKGSGAYSTSASAYGNSYLSGNNFSLFSGTWQGKGAYRAGIKNTMMHTGDQVPAMHSLKDGIRICHREFLTEISGSVAYTNQVTYAINAGVPNTFPFLAGIASNFQEYKVHGLMFYFKSTSASAITNSTNSAMGSVMMVAQYRADLAAPTSKVQLMNEMWAIDCKPSDMMALPIECARGETTLPLLYVRTGSVTSLQDVKFYDLCKVIIATSGFPAVNVIGEIHVAYDIELLKPVLSITGTPFQSYSAHIYATSILTATPLLNAVTRTGSTLKDLVVTNTTVSFTSEIGAIYAFYFYVQGTSVTTASVGCTTGISTTSLQANNTTSISYFNDTNKSGFYGIGTATATTVVLTPTVNAAAASTIADFWVNAISPDSL